MQSRAAVLNLLRKWLRPLRDCVFLRERSEKRFLFQVYLTEFDPWDLPKVRDALLLLGLLAKSDRDALKTMIGELCTMSGRHVRKTMDHGDFQELDVLFRIALGSRNHDVMAEMFGGLEAPENVERLAAAVTAVCNLCSNKAGSGGPLLMSGDVPLAVSLDATDGNEQQLVTWWKSVKVLISRYGGIRLPFNLSTPGSDANPLECAFVLGPIKLEVGGELTAETMNLVEEMVTTQSSIVFEKLTLAPEIEGSFKNELAVNWGRLLHCVVCTRADGAPQISKLEVIGGLHKPSQMARWCSVFANAAPFEMLTLATDMLDSEREERAAVWKYLAYAFFSRHARSQVASLHLESLILTGSDIDAVESILSIPNPTGTLFELDTNLSEGDAESGEYITATVKAGANVQMLPMEVDDESSGKFTLGSDVGYATVLQDDATSGLVRLVLPGFGVCQVHTEDVITPTDALPKSNLTSLSLQFDEDEDATAGLPRLIKLIGHGLTKLQIDVPSRMGDGVFDAIKGCTTLKVLRIEGVRISSADFIAAYRDEKLQIEDVEGHFDDMAAFVCELGDRTTRLARNLRRMACAFNYPRGMWEDPAVLESIVEMLKQNSKLQSFRINVPSFCYPEVTSALSKFDNEPVSVLLEPFSLPCRLAFLSVFDSSMATGEQLEAKRPKIAPNIAQSTGVSRFELDPLVMSKIFDFAGVCAHRSIDVVQIRISFPGMI